MKTRLTIKGFDGKVSVLEKKVPAPDHLEAQIKYPKTVQKDKTKYTRKIKHKNKGDENE